MLFLSTVQPNYMLGVVSNTYALRQDKTLMMRTNERYAIVPPGAWYV